MTVTTLLIATMPGLEEVAAEECRETLGLSSARMAAGFVGADVEDLELPGLIRAANEALRCADRVGILLSRAEVDSTDAAEQVVADTVIERWLRPGMSFAVRGVRRGEHAFNSQDLAGAVGAAVIDRMQAHGAPRPRVHLDDPDLVVRVDLDGNDLLLWLDTTGYRALHERTWRAYQHMASMRPTVANLLLRLGNWHRGDGRLLVDPFCGGGTIPIEAAHLALGVLPASQRPSGWAWQRVPELAGACHMVRSEPSAAASHGRIVGVERFRRHLDGAIENARGAGVPDRIRFVGGLAQQLERHGSPGAFADALVVTNPPFGRRVASPKQVARTYAEAAASWARCGVARVVTLTVLVEAMREALEGAGFGIEQEMVATYGSTPVSVFVAVALAAPNPR